jgi:probable phosphoglycerate mutase
MLPNVYLARHGQTEWSLTGQHTGRTDLPLTAQGEAEARHLGERLQGLHFALVLTSPLRRARRTCELAGFGAAVADPDLVEWDYGDYEGLRTADIRQRDPNWNLFRDGCPHGETPEQVGARADRVIARLRAAGGDGLVFAHGHILCVLGARWVGLPARDGRLLLCSTASVSVLSYEHGRAEEPALHLWNDTGRLGS